MCFITHPSLLSFHTFLSTHSSYIFAYQLLPFLKILTIRGLPELPPPHFFNHEILLQHFGFMYLQSCSTRLGDLNVLCSTSFPMSYQTTPPLSIHLWLLVLLHIHKTHNFPYVIHASASHLFLKTLQKLKHQAKQA